MISALDELLGERVRSLEPVHDYWQLSIGLATLTIVNPFRPEGARLREQLPGATLDSVLDNRDSELTLTFSNGLTITVDLRKDAYVGPEAVIYHRPDGSTVVW